MTMIFWWIVLHLALAAWWFLSCRGRRWSLSQRWRCTTTTTTTTTTNPWRWYHYGVFGALIGIFVLLIIHIVQWWNEYYQFLWMVPLPPPLVFDQTQLVTISEALHNQPLPSHLHWMADYISWHQSVRSEWEDAVAAQRNNDDDDNLPPPIPPILIVSHKAFGVADRLRALPYFVWQAHLNQRLLLLEWTRPCNLTEFLWPRTLDWTIPETIARQQRFVYHHGSNISQLTDHPIVHIDARADFYIYGMADFWRAFPNSHEWSISPLYQLFFVLAPPVQELYTSTLHQLGLLNENGTPKHYLGVHLRARYPDSEFTTSTTTKLQPRYIGARSMDADGIKVTPESTQILRRAAVHAVECVLQRYRDSQSNPQRGKDATNANNSQQQQPLSVYVASDTNEAVRAVVTDAIWQPYNNSTTTTRVVGMVTQQERKHLGRNNYMIPKLRRFPPSVFYPAFVDLWILAGASCLAIGNGGYGKQAAVLGGIPCLTLHQHTNQTTGYDGWASVTQCERHAFM